MVTACFDTDSVIHTFAYVANALTHGTIAPDTPSHYSYLGLAMPVTLDLPF